MAEYHDLCLLIPCFNNPSGLLRTLGSVSYQHSFAVLIVDDGSAAPLQPAELNNHLPSNARLFLLRNPTNRGITFSLNAGLDYIRANIPCHYIARLDAGDINMPGRLEAQTSLLEQNPEIVLCGTWCRFRGANGNNYVYRSATDDAAIRREMHRKCSFIHPTVIFRTSVLDTAPHYPTEFPHAEDYAFFWTLLRQGKGAILPNVLVECELTKSGISGSNRQKQLWSRLRIISTFGSPERAILGIFILLVLMVLPHSFIIWVKTRSGIKLS